MKKATWNQIEKTFCLELTGDEMYTYARLGMAFQGVFIHALDKGADLAATVADFRAKYDTEREVRVALEMAAL